MAVEIEAKIKVHNLGDVRVKLLDCGATPAGEVVETNTFFDTEDRSLLAADKGLRLRHKRDVAGAKEAFVITYKGPRRQGPLKSREENELTVGNDKDAIKLLESVGFIRILSFQKRRESWKLKDCLVELDELPYLGVFIEIEGPRDESVLEVRQMLALQDEPIVKASYIAMLMTYLQEHGITGKTVTFPIPADAKR